MTEKETVQDEPMVVTEVISTSVPMSTSELAVLMADYKKRHPEQFAGTPEWMIKVTAENAEQVYVETGVLFKAF